MNRRTLLPLLLALLLALTACAAAPGTASPTAAATPQASAQAPQASATPTPEAAEPPFASLSDSAGRTVILEKRPERIVSMTAANTEILFALGAGEGVVAVDDYSNYPEQAAGLPKVGGYAGPNLESIVALKPDLVLAGTGVQQEAVEQLEQLGVPVLAAEATRLADIPDTIRLVAQAIGADAAPLLQEMEARMEAVRQAAPTENKKRVYYVVSFGEYGDFTAGKDAFPTDMIAMAGGVSVTAALPEPWPSYTLEQIVASDPDVILLSGTQEMVESFKQSENYKQLRAVKEDRVYAVDMDASSRPGPRIVDALEQIAALLAAA